MHKLAMSIIGVLLLTTFAAGSGASDPAAVRTLDGSGNNPRHALGEAGTQYPRVAPRTTPTASARWCRGPSPRYVSNRIFNDVGQNLFSENGVSQWGWAWGQFIDHDFGLRDETPAESAPIAVQRRGSARELQERPRRDRLLRARPPRRARASTTPRQQINTHRAATSTRRTSTASTRVAARLAARRCRSTATRRTTGLAAAAERLPAARRRARDRRRAADGPDGRADGTPDEGGRRRRRAREREHRADGDPHAVRARAQPHRRRRCRRTLPAEDEVPDRAPRRRRRDRSTSPTPEFLPALGVELARTAATTRP